MSRLVLFSSEMELDAALYGGRPLDPNICISGVGFVDSAIGCARHVEVLKPDAIIFLGTCGAYPERGIDVGDVVVVKDAVISSGDVTRNEMRVPSLMPGALETDAAETAKLLQRAEMGAPETRMKFVRVSCTVGVTENDVLARSLASHYESDVENLEVYSVLRAAGIVPVCAVLGVTNVVGEGGGRSWAANYSAAMKRVAEFARI